MKEGDPQGATGEKRGDGGWLLQRVECLTRYEPV